MCFHYKGIFTTLIHTVPEKDDEDIDSMVQALLTADFEIGHYIREWIIPRAVLFFTGEALDDDDDFEEEDGGCTLGGIIIEEMR